MVNLKERLVFVTGASSGIGRSCARAFAREGTRLLLAARRVERLEELAQELESEYGTRSHVLQLDVRDAAAVDVTLAALPSAWRAVDLLVNAAGLARGLAPIQEGAIRDWDEMIDTNVKGLLYVTRAILPGMLERGCGEVINIGSIAGHEVYPSGSVYCASKYAVRALTQGLRRDLHATPVRVSSVDPGLVETEFSLVRFHGDAERARKPYERTRPLTPDDVAECVLFCATRPPHVAVAELVLLSADQSSATTIHRRD
ncbi:MAG: SDR family oxidoreductase [Candidatus Latescibacterota bacterium]|nr:MAG: SDR family oxidoreductase [Candidatus Latescibacterota bacterium]